MKLEFYSRLNNDLVRIYNFMVCEKMKFTAENVWNAERMCSGYNPTMAYANKFIERLDYVKFLAKNQPSTTITFKHLMYNEADGVFEIGEAETDTLKTFDRIEMGGFKHKYDYDQNKRVKNIEEKFVENLQDSK